MTASAAPLAALEGTVDRSSPIPLYFQLALLIETAIRDGRWRSGDRLPSEFEMCDQHGLSRTTIRRALSWLESQGYISRHKGAGTFVEGVPSRAWLLSSTVGFFEEEALRMGRTVTSVVLRAELGPLPAWGAEALQVSGGSVGATIERVREVDERRAIYVINHIAPDYADVAVQIAEAPNQSLYLILKERAGVEIHGGDRTVTAVPADARLGELLDIEVARPLLRIDSTSWDARKRPFDTYRAWVVPEIAPIAIRVSSVAAKPQPHDRQYGTHIGTSAVGLASIGGVGG